MTIQRLTPADGERLRALRLRTLRDAPDAFASTYEESVARPPGFWAQQLEELATFVAVLDGADVGVARGGEHDDDRAAAVLFSLWVTPEARGNGVGGALIDAVAGWARALGYRRLLLDVGDHNARAIAIYVRKGFEPTGNKSSFPPPRDHIHQHERVLKL